jgi:hypothetical protein
VERNSAIATVDCHFYHVSFRVPHNNGFALTYDSYLTFEIVIRVCIEFRLHVPVGFAGIEIPSRTVLIVGDLLLLFLVVSVNESMIMRLELDQGFRHAVYILFVGISCTAVVLLGIAERIYAIVSGVKWGLAWNKPEWSNYALVETLYCSVYLVLALFSLAVSLVVVAKKNRRTREHTSVDLCGMVCYNSPIADSTNVTQIPMQTLLIIAPALAVHSASAFYFSYFFQYKQKPQPPHLELVRMALVCLPGIVAMIGAWQAKREDVRMNSGSDITGQDDQREYMLERRSMETDTVPAYDAFGQKVMDVFEAPVVTSPRHRMWAPHGQSWVNGPLGYENIAPVAQHEE